MESSVGHTESASESNRSVAPDAAGEPRAGSAMPLETSEASSPAISRAAVDEKMEVMRTEDVKKQDGISSLQVSPLHRLLAETDDESAARVERLRRLLASGLDPNARDDRGLAPLHWCRDKDEARALLEHRADLEAGNAWGATPLFGALLGPAAGRPAEKRFPELDLDHDPGLQSALVSTRDQSDVHVLELVDFLLESGASPTARDDRGRTPLHYCRRREAAARLLRAGADPEARDAEGRTPLYLAMLCAENQRDAEFLSYLEVLLESGASAGAAERSGRTPLHACRRRPAGELLRRYGADVNAVTLNLETPLLLALASESEDQSDPAFVDYVEWLLASGASLDARTASSGDSPLHYCERKETARLLLSRDAKLVEARNVCKRTPLAVAFLCSDAHDDPGFVEYVRFLLEEAGASATRLDEDGCGPLHWCDGSAAADLLLAHGAEINGMSTAMQTPLFHAVARSSSPEYIAHLLERGAEPDAPDVEGRTALCYCGSAAAAATLLARGANLEARSCLMETPLLCVLKRITQEHRWTDPTAVELARFLMARANLAARDGRELGVPHWCRSVRVMDEFWGEAAAASSPPSANASSHGSASRAASAAASSHSSAKAWSVNIASKDQTPLAMVVRDAGDPGTLGHAALLEYAAWLLERGADPGAPALHGCRARAMAALLLARGGSALVNQKDEKGRVPLGALLDHAHENNRFDDPELLAHLRLLLESGADPNLEGARLLWRGAGRAVLELLLDHGAAIDAPNGIGLTLLHAAVVKDEPLETIAFWLERGADPNPYEGRDSPLHACRSAGSVELLVRAGARLESRNKSGATPLHEIVLRGKEPVYEVVQALLRSGADPNARTHLDATPLHGCASRDVAALLVDFGARLEARDAAGNTPFLSWMVRKPPVSPELLRWGAAHARTRVRNRRGETLLHRCRTVADVEALLPPRPGAVEFEFESEPSARDVEALLAPRRGAVELELSARDAEGCTPLHRVVARPCAHPRTELAEVTQLVRWLLENGANPRAVNERGETSLHLARFQDHSRLLLAAGASLKVRDRAGLTPVERADEARSKHNRPEARENLKYLQQCERSSDAKREAVREPTDRSGGRGKRGRDPAG